MGGWNAADYVNLRNIKDHTVLCDIQSDSRASRICELLIKVNGNPNICKECSVPLSKRKIENEKPLPSSKRKKTSDNEDAYDTLPTNSEGTRSGSNSFNVPTPTPLPSTPSSSSNGFSPTTSPTASYSSPRASLTSPLSISPRSPALIPAHIQFLNFSDLKIYEKIGSGIFISFLGFFFSKKMFF